MEADLERVERKIITNFIDKKLTWTPGTHMIEMMYFAKYNNQAGFNFSLDMIHKVPNPN